MKKSSIHKIIRKLFFLYIWNKFVDFFDYMRILFILFEFWIFLFRFFPKAVAALLFVTFTQKLLESNVKFWYYMSAICEFRLKLKKFNVRKSWKISYGFKKNRRIHFKEKKSFLIFIFIFFSCQFVNNFAELLLCRINVVDTFIFFQIWVISQSTEILIEPNIFGSKCSTYILNECLSRDNENSDFLNIYTIVKQQYDKNTSA